MRLAKFLDRVYLTFGVVVLIAYLVLLIAGIFDMVVNGD